MKSYNYNIARKCPIFGKYGRMAAFLTLFVLLFAGGLSAQGQCSGISFSFEQYEPCQFRAEYSNTSECFIEIRYVLESGSFASWIVNSAAGFSVQEISASELWVHHNQGFVPLGDQVPLLFTLPYDLNTSVNISYLDDCAQVGCELFGGIPIESCPDPQNASIIGVKYKECGNLPYFNQTPLSGWTIQLLDSASNIISEQLTDVDGSYAFFDLQAGIYVVRETQQPGWTASVPASGQATINLATSQQRITNFGNCPPPAPPCNCPAGTQTSLVNQVQNGDFSSSGGFNTVYTLNNTPSLQPGQYWIGSNPSTINAGFAACGDHTSGSGNMMVVNGSTNPNAAIWSQTYTMAPSTTYKFEYWVTSLSSASPAQLISVLQINNVLYGANEFAPVTTCTWEKKCRVWTTNASPATITISIYNQNIATTGNDFAIDDISFKKCVSPFGHLTGVVYRECEAKQYTDQPVLSGWTVQLLDTMDNFISEQVTDSSGTYAFDDLAPGHYYVKTVAQPGWTSTFPANGQTTVEIDAGGNVVANFGECRSSCLCSSILTSVLPTSSGPNACCYSLSTNVLGGGDGCYQYINIQVDAGTTISPSFVQAGWIANQINPQWIELIPPNGSVPFGNASPMTFCVSGISVHNILVTAGFNDSAGAHECDNSFTFSCSDCSGGCLPPTALTISDIDITSATLSWIPSVCAQSTWVYLIDEQDSSEHISRPLPVSSLLLDNLTPGTTYRVVTFSMCGTQMSGPSDTIIFNYPCYGGYTSCQGNLLSNGSFENPANTGLPNAADQIGLSAGWQQTNAGSGINGIADWYIGNFTSSSWPGFYNDVPNQQYSFMHASCGLRYAGFDLSTCEGISTQLSSPINVSTGYNIGFWWSPKEPVTSNFTFLAILSGGNCTVNTANSGTACTHQCGGDFHVPITATTLHQPGTWYPHSFTANAPMTVNHLTFTAKSGGPIVENYIYLDEVCVRKVLNICEVDKPKIAYNPAQPNAFLGEADLGAGSTLVSAVWDFGDGTQDSSCCLGSVIHDFAPGTYDVCLTVTAADSSGTTCSNRSCTTVIITQSGGKCDHVAAFLQSSPLGDCCYTLNTNNIELNCFTQIDVTLSSGNFVNSIFGPGWNIANNGNMISLTPSAGGFIPVGQDIPVTICDPGGTEPYTLDVDFVYAGGVCDRTFNYSCFPDTSNNCCTDFSLFQTLASQVNANEQYGDCSISVNGTALNACMRIVWNWGDGTVEGPYTDNTPITHNYTTAGPHTVCYTVQEVDATGQICWTWQKCLDLPVHCNDLCMCLGFTNLQFNSLVSSPPPPVLVDCDNLTPVELPCIANDAFYEFEGNFGCTNECTSSIGYEFFDLSNNLLVYGQATYNSVLDEFSISQIKFPPGTYVLALTGYCGVNDTCYCDVTFTIPDCPCCSVDNEAFSQTIENATSISLDPANCKATLNIGTLPCQRIEWINWGDGVVSTGPFLSGTMPMHSYAQSGPYTITYVARELNPITGLICYNKQFTETIQLYCNCSCGTYDMEIRLGGALNQPVVCGQTVDLGLGQGFAFYPKFQCQGSFCPPSALVNWTLIGPGTNLSGTETTVPGAVFTILPVNPGQFTTPGLYTLTMTGHCDLNLCPCVITFNVLDPCCTDQAAFLVAAAAVQTFGTLGTCTLSFQAVGLSNCMRIRYDWGDNSSSGPFGNNVLETHTYAGTGTYNVCYTIEEVDFFGNVCWTYQSCEQVFVDCNSCECGIFTDLYLAQTQVTCGGPTVTLGCPSTGKKYAYYFSGKYTCSGVCPAFQTFNYTLTGPSGSFSNTSGHANTPYFGVAILPTWIKQNGLHTLTITPNCNGVDCPPCVITFNVSCPILCPCDVVDFNDDLSKGYSTILTNNSCRACFTPNAMTDCDIVEWFVGGTSMGTLSGTKTFCHTFPSSGTYNVMMSVTRKNSSGVICASNTFSTNVTVSCNMIADCDISVIGNPRFSEGAIAGGMNSGGATNGWNSPWGEAKVVEGYPGSTDGWTIKLSGNSDTSDVLSTVQPICLEKSTGTFDIRFAIEEKGTGGELALRLYRGTGFGLDSPAYWNPIRCLSLATLDLQPLEMGWYEAQIPFDISDWIAVDSCGDFDSSGVLVRPAVFVRNVLNSNQGGTETFTVVHLDNLCLDGTLVPVNDPGMKRRFRIFPNPNPGTFSVELPEAATPNMAFRVIGVTGQMVKEQSAQAGGSLQTVQVGDLPAGLYFLQVVSEGKVLAVEKFVKQ